MDWFFGHVGFSFIDRWAVIHFAFWLFAGSLAWSLLRKAYWTWGRPVALLVCLALAFGWEVIELILAPRNPSLWLDWFVYQGAKFGSECVFYIPGCHYESWWNSWVSDPLTCILGVLLAWTMLDWKKG